MMNVSVSLPGGIVITVPCRMDQLPAVIRAVKDGSAPTQKPNALDGDLGTFLRALGLHLVADLVAPPERSDAK